MIMITKGSPNHLPPPPSAIPIKDGPKDQGMVVAWGKEERPELPKVACPIGWGARTPPRLFDDNGPRWEMVWLCLTFHRAPSPSLFFFVGLCVWPGQLGGSVDDAEARKARKTRCREDERQGDKEEKQERRNLLRRRWAEDT